MTRWLLTLIVVGAMVGATPVLAQSTAVPEAAAGRAAYAPFEPLIGRTWRGVSIGPDAVEDVQRWEWALGGHAVRIVHSVNAGAYAGETLVFRDPATEGYVFHYFTTGGFHTTGVIVPTGPGAYRVSETVSGGDWIREVGSTAELGEDGVLRVRSRFRTDDGWSEAGGFDYVEDGAAVLILPSLPPAMDTEATAAPLLTGG
jgi:hypothetical protein